MADDERVAQIQARYEAATNEVPPGWQYEDFHHNAFPDIAYLLAGLAELAEYADGLGHDLGVVYEACTAAVRRAEAAEAALAERSGRADWLWDEDGYHMPCCSQLRSGGRYRCHNGPLTGDAISSGDCGENHEG